MYQRYLGQAILFTPVFLLLLNVSSLAEEAISPFVFEGCVTVAEGTEEDPNLWCECCLEHDLKYWKGGTWDDRKHADLAFQDCVSEMSKSPSLGMIFYLGVRVGGSPYYKTSSRWGYGWEYGRGYTALTEEERADAEQKARVWLEENEGICLDFN